MKLRFDGERSNLEDLPMHVRKPLFEILIGYSQGAARRINNRWLDFKIDENFLTGTNYKFDEK